MTFDLLTINLLHPPVLFFILGAFATLVGSDLEIPQPIPKLLSLYLLCAIGFHGGVELSGTPLSGYIIGVLLAAILSAIIVPLYSFFMYKRSFSIHDAGALAACYGSVSAVTFIAAQTFLKALSISSGGYMVAGLALMETPAIVVGVLLIRMFSKSDEPINWSRLLHESFFNGAVLLILGSLCIGYITGPARAESYNPFFDGIFKGVLCLFMLELGILACKRLSALLQKNTSSLLLGIIIPLINASAAITIAYLFGFTAGDAFLFTALCAGASYIAVPAALRISVPEANPGLYIPMALGITFPFNIIVGLPIYMFIIQKLWNI